MGCGTGIYSYWLYEQGLDVVGIDISKNMLDVAKKKKDTKNITFLQGDISNLPFANETFDLVISNIVLEFTHNPQVIVKEALRVVKKGGRLVIGFIGKESTWGKMYHEKGKNDPTSVFAHAKFFNTDEIAQLNETPPIQFNYGLYVAMDEFTTIEAARELEKDRTKTSSDQDAGYIVAKWQKI
ncbi:class I SAM-dependent methyltransferase [Aliibacillus thermotolerans]|uniref:Class I SAM-dependent methyltransferase n=1 Tax=Aliibacillus thermotolerans TaxID=1834418 RepID=A0ABW0U5E3_9BACI|nr:class I SAM-dependent methyltransferase [Aliibacillus thermotolerans]